MATKKIEVQMHAENLEQLPAVAAGLRAAGMTIVDQIDELGHFSGLADEARLPALKAVNGVKSVRTTGNEGDPDPNDYSIG